MSGFGKFPRAARRTVCGRLPQFKRFDWVAVE